MSWWTEEADDLMAFTAEDLDLTTPPAPPDQTEWWNVATTKAAVLAKLRLGGLDVDAALIESLVPVAGYQINRRLDRTTPLTEPEIAANQPALETLVIALYLPPVRNPDGTYVRPVETLALAGRQRRGIA